MMSQGATAQPAQPGAGTPLISALESNGFKQLAGLFAVVKIKDRDFPANLNLTVLAPTDQVRVNTSTMCLGLSCSCSSCTLLTLPAAVQEYLSPLTSTWQLPL
jgi:hypothetical protein